MPFFIPNPLVGNQTLNKAQLLTNMRSHKVNIERNIENMLYAYSFKLSYQETNSTDKDINMYLQVLQPL